MNENMINLPLHKNALNTESKDYSCHKNRDYNAN